jgi:hypothetical protein
VDYCAGAALAQGGHQRGTIPDVTLNQPRFPARDALHPGKGFWLAVAEVVENRDVLAGVEQFNAGMRTYVTGAARNENHGWDVCSCSGQV